MPQFLIAPEAISGGSFTLSGEEAHHLLRVHRARTGDTVRVFDGSGRRFLARIEATAGREVRGTVIEEMPESPAAYRLVLHLALLPRQAFETALEKGTELGVAAFQPVATRRAVARTGGGSARRRRWEAVLLAAAKQCLRARIPELLPTATFAEAIAACRGGAGLIAWEGERGARLEQALPAPGGDLHLFIGPEGGFTPDEVVRAQAAGLKPVTLGANVLRAETAALAAAARILR